MHVGGTQHVGGTRRGFAHDLWRRAFGARAAVEVSALVVIAVVLVVLKLDSTVLTDPAEGDVLNWDRESADFEQ